LTGRDEALRLYAEEATLVANWVGAVTRREFFATDLNFVELTPPQALDSDYLEWVDLIESIVQAGPRYTMIELGAGYGRWTVNAALAVRSLGRSRYRLMAVEAEPTHFAFLRQHCKDNGVGKRRREGSLTLIEAAVDRKGGRVEFAVGDPSTWYGQAIADGTWSPKRTKRVKAVQLSGLVRKLRSIDLIDLDIQGAERDVIDEAIDDLDATTKRIHVGTHNARVEDGLRHTLDAHGWTCVVDYAAGTTSETPWGPMEFQDGVQSWVNPRLVDAARLGDYDQSRDEM
jgi:FkbM family methyltransferase